MTLDDILKKLLTPAQIKAYWAQTEEERDLLICRGVASLITDTPLYLKSIDKTLKDILKELQRNTPS